MRQLFLFLLCFGLCPMVSFAQDNKREDYKKLMSLGYVELDSLMMVEYRKASYEKAIFYIQASREKAKADFGEQDSIFALYTANLGYLYTQIGQYEYVESLYLQAMNIRKKKLGEQHPDYAASLNNLATMYESMGTYSKAEPLYLQAMAIKRKALGEESPEYANSLNNLALLYDNMGNYTKAELLHTQAMAIKKKALGEQHLSYAQSLNNLALLYGNIGNYNQAEHLYLQGIEIQKKVLGEEHPDYATGLNNLALLYDHMGNYAQAEPLYLQSMAIRKKTLGEEHPKYATSLNNLAALYKTMGNYNQAKSLYLQAIAIRKKVLGELHPLYALSINNLAILYEKTGDYKKAKPLYLQALAIRKKALGEHHPEYAFSLNNLANFSITTNELDSAFHYCRFGIIANAPAMDSSFKNWEDLDTFKYNSNKYINNSINTLLRILWKQYNQTKDKNKLEQHYAVSQAAIRLNKGFRNGFITERDKLRILSENNAFILAAIRTGIELKRTDYEITSFDFAEMDKGVLLLESSKADNAQEFGGLPDTLVEQEKSLQKKQNNLIAKLLEKRPDNEKDSLRRVLNGVNQDIDIFTKILKNKYPKYAALKYDSKTASVKEIQTLLDEKTALLEYIIGDSVIYLFYVNKKQIKLIPIHLSNNLLAEKIKILHNTLSDYKLAAKEPAISYQKYTENAFWFYENLVAPALKNNTTNIDKLLIVSDGELGNLPFEAFLTKAAPQIKDAQQGLSKEIDYHKLSYLSNDYKISYNYSATIFADAVRSHGEKRIKETNRNQNNGQILAMVSNYDIKADASIITLRLPYEQRLRNALNPLPAARKEIETLAENFNGFFAFDKNASEKFFKEKAGNYAIIHLAMHGLLDSKNPIISSLAFTEDGDSLENNFLHAYEISKMKLNADLVVLSACETGYGKFEKGNGIASLAQAFAYAGAPAMIVSLWQVNDFATSEIMKNLYQNLADGMEKDEALQQAKMKYMKEATGVMAHPAFWSPFILMGNTDAVYLKTKFGWLWWGVGGIVLALGSIAFAMRNRKKE